MTNNHLLGASVTSFVLFLLCLGFFLYLNVGCASSRLGSTLNVAVVGSGIADYATTRSAITGGRGREGNALLGQAAWSQGLAKSLGIAGVIGAAQLVERKGSSQWAHVIRAIAITAWSVAARHNYHVGRR